MSIQPRSRRAGERGSSTLEFVIIMPSLVLVIGLLAFGGRLALAKQGLEAAAFDAARSASIERSASEAQEAADTTAGLALASHGYECSRRTIRTYTSGFSVPVGTPAAVTVTATCVMPLSDLALPGVPGSMTLTATAISALDTYRGR